MLREGRVLRSLEHAPRVPVPRVLWDEPDLATTLIRQADIAVELGRLQPGTRMGHDNAITQMLARRLGLPVPELAPDYLAHRQATPRPGAG